MNQDNLTVISQNLEDLSENRNVIHIIHDENKYTNNMYIVKNEPVIQKYTIAENTMQYNNKFGMLIVDISKLSINKIKFIIPNYMGGNLAFAAIQYKNDKSYAFKIIMSDADASQFPLTLETDDIPQNSTYLIISKCTNSQGINYGYIDTYLYINAISTDYDIFNDSHIIKIKSSSNIRKLNVNNSDNYIITEILGGTRNLYNNSTFSGWCTQFYNNSNDNLYIDALQFIIKSRIIDDEPNTITDIKIYITLDDNKGDVIAYYNITDSIPTEYTTITAYFDNTVVIYPDTRYCIIIAANKYLDIKFGNNYIANYGTFNQEDVSIISRYLVNGDQNILNLINGSNASIYVKLYSLKSNYIVPTINKISNIIDDLSDEKYITIDENKNTISTNGEAVEWEGSTFFGWGGTLGYPTNFNGLHFKIKARPTNTRNIEKIFVCIGMPNISASSAAINMDTVLYSEILNVNIAPSEIKEYTIHFDEIINENNEQIYAYYYADNYISAVVEIANVIIRYGVEDNNLYDTAYLALNDLDENPITNFSTRTLTKVASTTNNKVPFIHACTSQNVNLLSDTILQNQILPLINDTSVSDGQNQNASNYIPKICIADKIYAVVNDTLQLFYRGFILAVNPYNYNIEIICDIGKQTSRYYTVNPTINNVGEHNMTINIRDNTKNILSTKTIKLIVANYTQSLNTNINILCMGDSLTSGGIWPAEAYRRLTANDGSPKGIGKTNITFIGTKNKDGAGYEGYGGWTWNSYLTAERNKPTTADMWVYCTHNKTTEDQHSLWKDSSNNIWSMETIESTRIKFTRYNSHTGTMPTSGTLTNYQSGSHTESITYSTIDYADGNPFWNDSTNQMDLVDYCTNHGWNGVDYIYTLLSWNAFSSYIDNTTNHAHAINCMAFLDKVHEQYPNCKVRIMGLQMPSYNGGTGQSYGCNSQYSNWYGLFISAMHLNETYQNICNMDKYRDWVEYVEVAAEFDTEYLMPYNTVAVNTRLSSQTEIVGLNGVHPSNEGYLAIGDAVYRNMIASLFN